MEVKTVFQYLRSELHDEEFAALYSNPESCLAVYRSLDGFDQYLVRTMLFTTSSSSPSQGSARPRLWTLDDISALRRRPAPAPGRPPPAAASPPQTAAAWSDRSLSELRILIRSASRVAAEYGLSPIFAANLAKALISTQGRASFVSLEGFSQAVPKLESYAKEKWETVLYYTVGQDDSRGTIVHDLVRSAGLVRTDVEDDDDYEEGDSVRMGQITPAGFQFLLLGLTSQLWVLLQHYIRLSEELSLVGKVDVLNFLFSLSFLDVGPAYLARTLSKAYQKQITDLVHLGLLRRRTTKGSDGQKVFYVTPLASEFCRFGNPAAAEASSARWRIPGLHGPIVVQTNFMVYAYTKSPIQIALLSLFAKMQFKLPNLVTAVIDRESVRSALLNGITSEQILSYLWLHAHQKMREMRHPVPVNICNQIRLWEKERNRIRQTPAIWMDNFQSLDQFQAAKRFVEVRGWLMMHKLEMSGGDDPVPETMWLVVRPDPRLGEEKQVQAIHECCQASL